MSFNVVRSSPAFFPVSSGRWSTRWSTWRPQSAPSITCTAVNPTDSTSSKGPKKKKRSLKSRASGFFRRVFCLKAEREDEEDGYDCSGLLGEGAFGKVLLATRRSDGQAFAIKAMARSQVEKTERMSLLIQREEAILQIGRGQSFLATVEEVIHTTKWIHFVMPCYTGGDLFNLIDDRGRLDENTAKFYAAELVMAVSWLHNAGFIHRDIKSENILLDAHGHLVLSDFGLCHRLTTSRDDPYGDRCCWTRAGTITYQPPEALDPSRPPYGRPADWWAVGIVVFDMLIGSHPFDKDPGNLDELFDNIHESRNPVYFEWFGEPFLQLDYRAMEFIFGLLTLDPDMRLGSGPDGVDNIKQSRFFDGMDWHALGDKRIPPPIEHNVELQMADPVPKTLRFIAAPVRKD